MAVATGAATYEFAFTSSDIARAQQKCASGGGLRGVLLGVEYNDSPGIDDVALLSKKNCGGGSQIFDGYASGGALTETDIESAFFCGLNKSTPRFENPNNDYWTPQELYAAAEGRLPIVCNFNLSKDNAPSDPGDSSPFCDVKQAQSNVSACASGVAAGKECSQEGAKCCLGGSTALTCRKVNPQSLLMEWSAQ